MLTAGPTPRVELEDWQFTLKVGPRPVKVWSWAEFSALPRTSVTRDIHCVTSWSKLGTQWEGVTIDDILADASLPAPTGFVLAHCFDGYSTNVPLADLTSDKAMVALQYEGEALPRDHGGPARLLVWRDVLFRDELLAAEESEAGFSMALALTREPPTRPSDYGRHVDAAMLAHVAGRLPATPGYVFVCGSNAFVDVAADGALDAGLAAASIRTERYGA